MTPRIFHKLYFERLPTANPKSLTNIIASLKATKDSPDKSINLLVSVIVEIALTNFEPTREKQQDKLLHRQQSSRVSQALDQDNEV